MLVEISGICRGCKSETKLLSLNGEPHGNCKACGAEPFSLRILKGVIYVVSNPNQNGVKIGLTTKSVEQRLKSLNSTGVPGDFEPIAIFPSERPRADEKKVHEKLRRYNIAKEHFELDPVDAALKVHRALNKRRPIFFDEQLEEQFEMRLERARLDMKLRLSGAS